jgi:hypothetical protein
MQVDSLYLPGACATKFFGQFLTGWAGSSQIFSAASLVQEFCRELALLGHA